MNNNVNSKKKEDYCSGGFGFSGRCFETGVHLTETGQRFDELTANFNLFQ